MKKLLLVDGNSMLFRAYYATAYGQKMTSSKGIPTNAVFGFASMLQKAIDLVQPDSMLVAFDAGKHTFRHDLYPDYKGGRKPAPDDLVPQFQMARDYLDGYHIRWVEMPDIEADDLIGTVSRLSPDYKTVILTSDHDLLQLVDDTTTVMLMKKGLTDMAPMTPSAMKEEMGITPTQIIDLKGLMGDHSDNIPGIPGIGEKTAVKLLQQYGTVEEVLAHDHEIKGKLGEKVQNNHASAELSKTLATIRRDVPLDFTADDCRFEPDYASLIRFFESVDMNSLVRKYQVILEEQKSSDPSAAPKKTYEAVKEIPESFLNKELAVYLDGDQEPFYASSFNGLALSDGKKSYYISLEDAEQDQKLLAYLAEEQPAKIGFDVKRAMHQLKRTKLKIAFAEDAMIAASLADSSLTSPEKIYEACGIATTKKREDIYGTKARPKLADLSDAVQFACENAAGIYAIFAQMMPKIHEASMDSLYRDMEMPLTRVLYEMEETGITCSKETLGQLSAEMKEKMDRLQDSIYAEAGGPFNINSPKQLAEVLFDKLGLPGGKKRSTSAEVLEKLNGFHPIIGELLEYRKLSKIYGTYAEGLQRFICSDGKIHTLYNQCATQTGRLSSSDPNLQNISVRDEQGKVIRKAFLPSEGCVLLSSDYHQIELRMLASMAGETSMIEAFRNGVDIHTKTAMDVFGIDKPEDVTSEQRRRAKTVNFGIVYGISDFGLAEQLGISRREAADFIETYYQKFPKIRTYMNSIVAFCEEHGYVTTLCGRRREIPEIHDKNRMVREFGKRAAMNAPIQGSAADLIKIAMLKIDAEMKKQNVKSKMILQVHDELIFDVPKEELEQMTKLVTDGMCNAMKLDVPLTVECASGSDWYEAK